MKNIKTFESFSQGEINESIGGIIKSILAFPINVLGLLTMQFVGGRTISKVIKERLLDIYGNIDTLITTLENILTKNDITDVEKRKVLSKLKDLKKVKEKYPNLQSYKQEVSKNAPLYNFKNRDYLRSQIWEYEPRQMSAIQVVAELTKVYSLIERGDVTGEVATRTPFQDRLNGLLAQERNPNR